MANRGKYLNGNSTINTCKATLSTGTKQLSLSSATAGAQSFFTPSLPLILWDIVANWTIAVGTITASASTRVDVYVWGTNDDAGYPGGSTAEVITGTAGSITLSANGNAALRF